MTLFAAVLVTATLANTTPGIAGDAITVTVDQPIHALGEGVVIAVAYDGGVHGDIKLSFQDASGNTMNQWTWSQASSDPFKRTISYTPVNAGSYLIKSVHQPHHMEPSVSSTVQVALWSAQLLNLNYTRTVNAGKPIQVIATVSYYFTQPTPVKLELWSDLENKTVGTVTQSMNGQGTATLALPNVVFSATQGVTARISYQSPSGSWMSDVTGGSYNGQVTVVP